MSARFVVYEGKRYLVLMADAAYEPGRTLLQLKAPFGRGGQLWVDESDCSNWEPPPRTRKLSDADVILEFDSRGQVFLRRRKCQKRYPTTLRALYDATVKAAVSLEKFRKKQEKKKGVIK